MPAATGGMTMGCSDAASVTNALGIDGEDMRNVRPRCSLTGKRSRNMPKNWEVIIHFLRVIAPAMACDSACQRAIPD